MESISLYIIFVALALINTAAFFVVGYDKRKSSTGQREDRIPEGIIFFLASVFGGVGIFAGMQIFRHKTRKWYFQIGIPLLIIQNLVTLYATRDVIGTI